MGKASRRKKKQNHFLAKSQFLPKERHQASMPLARDAGEEIIPMAPAEPRRLFGGGYIVRRDPSKMKVYRFLKEEKYADAFAKGTVKLGTLEACRRYEDPRQGDPGEGSLVYRSGTYSDVNADHPGFLEDARRAGIDLGPDSHHVHFSDNICHRWMPDALVLCTTLEFDPERLSDTFGHYCVEITDVSGFFLTMTQALAQRYPIDRYYASPVQYVNREYQGAKAPGHPGFVKPPDQYQDQQEFRMLWTVKTHKVLTPGIIEVPALSQYCRRIV